jgi:hypothetical protein
VAVEEGDGLIPVEFVSTKVEMEMEEKDAVAIVDVVAEE